MNDKLRLSYRGHVLGEYAVGPRPLAVGSGEHCDIVVHDPEVAEHHWLVVSRRGTVVAYDLACRQPRRAAARHVPLDSPLPLGRDYALTRVLDSRAREGLPDEASTDRIDPAVLSSARLGLLVGHGSSARRYYIDGRPLQVGSAADNDVVIADRAASGRHCRLEPGECGLVVRDLGSLNGTFVNGVKVLAAQLTGGSQIRVGRTDLRIVERSLRENGNPAVGMVAESAEMLGIVADTERMAALSWPVLIQGESGTGKECIASALHQAGPRSGGRFVALNAGGLPRELVESELFGHERGAFTGAVTIHRGVFEQANGGTLFLDEIGELPLDMQARLLRAIESQEIRRVGGESDIAVDVRLVCATHRDLNALVAEKRFRHDLFFRITRLLIEVPPLRSRPEDIRALTRHFLAQIAAEVGPRRLSTQAFARLEAHRWPGNARELSNVLSAACAATSSPCIDAADIERVLGQRAGRGDARSITAEIIERAVEEHDGNQSAAARALGISRSTLRDRLLRARGN
jgi:transcriptional regulator with AAA-type ATPase domain